MLGRVTGADPGVNELYVRTLDERDETLRYDQLVVAVGSVSRVLPVPGLAENALGFKNLADAIALRNRALLNLEIAESLPGRRGPARVPDLRVRRRRLRGRRGLRRAPGLRERHDRPVPALPRGRHALDPRRGAGPDHARDPGEPGGGGVEGAEAARHGDPHRYDARERGRSQRGAVHRRACTDPAGVLDRRRADPRRGEAARPAARAGRPHRDRRHDARQGLGQRVGHRRRRGGAGPRQAPPCALTADLSARHQAGPARREQRGRRAGGQEAAAVPVPHARRVRGLGPATRPWRPSSGCACAASPPGSRLGPTTCT